MKRRKKGKKGKITNKASGRVIGGDITDENEIPWQVFVPMIHNILTMKTNKVALLKSDNSWDGCGGVLLSCDPVIVITAAHCVMRKDYHFLAICDFQYLQEGT